MSGLNEIQEQGLGQVLRRRLGILSSGSPAPELAPEFLPVLVLENDRPEWSQLKGERLAAATSSIVIPTAGQFAVASLFNPLGSNTIAVLELIDVTAPAGSGLRIAMSTNDAFSATPVTNTVRDRRWIQPGSAAASASLRFSSGTTPALPLDTPMWSLPNGVRTEFKLPVVLTPGSCVYVIAVTASENLNFVSFAWRERGVVSGELLP